MFNLQWKKRSHLRIRPRLDLPSALNGIWTSAARVHLNNFNGHVGIAASDWCQSPMHIDMSRLNAETNRVEGAL